MRTPIHGVTPRNAGRGRRIAGRPPVHQLKQRTSTTPRANSRALSQQVGRYARSYRLALEVLAREHPNCEDLLFASPAVAVSLAARRGPPADRGAALHLIRNGAPLSDIHAELELPFWLRKLPPEAFLAPPAHPFPQPDQARAEYDPRADGAFGRRALNLLPQDAWPGWLPWCAAARAAGGDDFALWLMSHRLRWARAAPEEALGPLAAYVWFSERPHLPAARHLAREWTPEFALTAALRNTRRWLQRLLFEITSPPPASPWRRSRRVRGYVFEPLFGVDAFVEEGLAMRNCMASYAEAAAEGRCRIFAIRRGGRSVANMELRPPLEKGGAPEIVQLLGRGNRRASAASVRAVHEWRDEIMQEIKEKPDLKPREADAFAPPDLERWRAMMEPFEAAHPGAAALSAPLLAGPREAFIALDGFRPLIRGRQAD